MNVSKSSFPHQIKIVEDCDPITVTVIASALSTIAEEMGKSIIRSAYSTNIKERQDCSTAVFDPAGNTIALAEHIPIHLGSLLGIAKYVLEHSDLFDLKPGDAFIGNDAYTGGGTHLNDFVLMEPVFYNNELVAWVANLAHHSDFVDRSHKHIFQEGLRIPPVRLYRNGVLQADIHELILLNCQVPRERIHDLSAQMAANHLGVQRVQGLCDKYGATLVAEASAEFLLATERRTRAGITAIPDGTYCFHHEFDSNLIDDILDLQVEVTVKEDEIFFNFPDAPAQMPAPINMVYTALLATVYFAVKAMIDPDIAVNEGFYRPIHVQAREGSVLNSVAPAAVYSRTDIAMRLVDMIFAALAPVIPDRVAAGSTGGTLLTTSGIHPLSGHFYVYNEMQGGGMGARAGKDGLDGVQVNITNTANLPVEALEAEYPVFIESYELVQDSGGPGRYRGGMSMCRRVRILNHVATINAGGTSCRIAPFGLDNGLNGTVATVKLPRGVKPLHHRKGILQPGEWVGMQASGGGGFGDPKLRDRKLVLRDLQEGRISLNAAKDIYALTDAEIADSGVIPLI